MFELLQPVVRAIQPLLVPICFVAAWSFILLLGWSLWTALRDTVHRSQQLHKIPCADCQFFTRDYHLKCTVHPFTALSEEAINCVDYEPNRQPTLPVPTNASH